MDFHLQSKYHLINKNLFRVGILFLGIVLLPYISWSQNGLMSNNGALISVKNKAMISVQGDVINSNNGIFHNSDTIYLTGDWENNAGNEAFSSLQEGIVILRGDEQRIKGADITRFYDLRLEGIPTSTKFGDIDVYINGFLRLNTHEFNVDYNVVSVFNTALDAVETDTGFVSSLLAGGLLRHMASTQKYFFPVGSSIGTVRYRPLELQASSANPNAFKVRMAHTFATNEGYDLSVRVDTLCDINPYFYHRIYQDAGTDGAKITSYYKPTEDEVYDRIAHWQTVPQWESTGAATSGYDATLDMNYVETLDYITDYVYPAFALAIISDSLELVADMEEVCSDSTVTFTATAGYPHYEFFLNDGTIQNGTSNTYSSNTLANGDIISVVSISEECVRYSNAITVTVYSNEVTLTADNLQICQDSIATFTATNGFLNYEFFVNNTSVQNGTASIYTANDFTNGSIVSVLAMDANCNYWSNELIINVYENEVVLTSDVTASCPDSLINFSASGVFDNYDFWLNGVSIQNGESSTYSTATLNDGDVISVLASDANCNYLSNEITIMIYENEVNLFSDAISICPDSVVTFTADAGFNNYEFYVNGVSVQNDTASIFVTTTLSNEDIIFVLATDDNCNYWSNTIPMTVYESLILLEATALEICPEELAQFTATEGYNNYEFYVNGELAQNSSSNIYNTDTLSHGDLITVIATNEFCNYLSNAIQMTVYEDGATLMASTDISCPDVPVLYTANTGFEGYDFYINGNLVQSGESNILISTAVGNEDSLQVIANSFGCSYESETIGITLYDPIIADADGDTTIFVGGTAFPIVMGAGNYDYTWSPTGSLDCVNCPNPTAMPIENTIYTVVITTTDGCVDTLVVRVAVQPLSEESVVVPNAITPNGDGRNDTWNISGLPLFDSHSIVIFNRWGDELFRTKDYQNDWNGTWQGRKLPAGTYYYIVTVEGDVPIAPFRGDITIIRK